jgi:D-xylono/L-arabinono-1,4-lactonase
MSALPYIESSTRCELGEGPLWHPVHLQLYVTDIAPGTVRVLDSSLNLLKTLEFGRPTTALTWQEDGTLLFYHDKGAITRLSSDEQQHALVDHLPGEERGLFNDVISDPAGRVLCGTQPVDGRAGRLYCLERDLTRRVLLEDIREPNGLAFSPDHRTLYFSDSTAQIVWRFSYDWRAGRLSDRQVFLETEGEVLPDGLTVDADGFVWAALWNGGAVIRIDPTGRIVRSIRVPAMRATSVAFGGPLLNTLYVTTARQEPGTSASGSEDRGGAIFAFHGIGRGRPEFPSALASFGAGLCTSSATSDLDA